jgi:polysaccharide export outer membrane protein
VRQTPDGPKEKTIDLWAALSSGDFTGDVQLTDGDTIKVPTAETDSPENQQIADAVLSSTLAPSQVQVQVVGEVKQAGVVNLQPRTNSVLNAIALAGGPTNEADFHNIAVARLARSGKVERFPLDFNKLADGSQTFNVRTGDVVLVGRRGDRQAAEDSRSFLGPVGDVLRILFFPFRIFF